jgi:hypothetical protein
MTGSAKQSTLSLRRAMDCFVASLLAMTLMGLNTTSRSRGARRPEFCISFALQKRRGRGEDRVRAAPAVSRAICIKKCAHEHTGSAENTPASPTQWLYGLYEIVLVTGFLATIIPEKRWLLPNLTPAPGRRTRTISPYAFATLVSRSISVHRIPPHVRDDRDRPSFG